MSRPKTHTHIPNSFDPAFNYIIPSFVFNYEENLVCAKSKLLYGAINAICSSNGYCCATDAYLCEIYGFKNRSLTRYLKQLKEQGLIKINYVDGNFKRRIIRVVSYEDIQKSPKSRLLARIKAKQKELKIKKSRHASHFIKVVDKGRLYPKAEPQNLALVPKKPNSLPPKSAKDIATSGQHNITKNINIDLGTSLIHRPINEVPKSRPDNTREVIEHIKKIGFDLEDIEKIAKEFIDYYNQKNWHSKGKIIKDWKYEFGYYCAMRTLGNLEPDKHNKLN